jgi:hypothetical protein
VGGAWIRRFDGKMIQPPKTFEKRADSHLSAARCVGGLALRQTHSLKTRIAALLKIFYAKPDL